MDVYAIMMVFEILFFKQQARMKQIHADRDVLVFYQCFPAFETIGIGMLMNKYEDTIFRHDGQQKFQILFICVSKAWI